MWDVGAQDGYTALIYARLGGRVEAFEPNPSACERLLENLGSTPTSSPGDASAVRGRAGVDLGSLPPLDVVKVDVDEAEPTFRDALLPMLSARKPLVVWETHGARNVADSRDALDAAGYEVRVVRQALWKKVFPEYRPLPDGINRWLVAWPPA